MRRMGALAATLVLLCASAAPALAATNSAQVMPAQNLPPNPNFDAECSALNGQVIQGYCAYNPTTGWTFDTPQREDAALLAIDNARVAEGLQPLRLPSNFGSLTSTEQQFVLANLERIARGLPPMVAISPQLDAAAAAGEAADQDPQVPSSLEGYAFGSNWAGDQQPAVAMYGYMYMDGWGGTLANTPNEDCTSQTAPGCWAHRKIVLGNWGVTGLFGGAALRGGPSGMGSSAQLYVGYDGPPVPVTYTWADAVAQGAGAGDPLGQPQTGTLWPFSDMGSTTWAAGAAAVLAGVGVVQGTAPGTFSPNAPVQLQEMVVFLGRVLGWAGASASAPPGTAAYAQSAMGYAAAFHLLPAGVAPAQSLTRLQTVQLVVAALRLRPSKAPMPFVDLGGLSAQQLAVLTTAVADGLLRGEGQGVLAPLQPLTRAQAVLLLERALLLRARTVGAMTVGGQPLAAIALSNGQELYRLGSIRFLSAAPTQDPYVYWTTSASPAVQSVLAESGGPNTWWSGTFIFGPEQQPSWAKQAGATLYEKALALLWPAGEQGVGPALFSPTVHVIAFGTDVQQLLPAATQWTPALGSTATDPMLALASALE